MSDTTTIDLIRHGQPQGGTKFRGWIDDPLSEQGWSQMRAAVANVQPWDAIVSSPLLRCCDFAQELSTRTGRPIAYDERIKEIGFGTWEGQTAAQIRVNDPEALRRFYRNPVDGRPTGAEPLPDFAQRVIAALREAQHCYAGNHVLMVTHAGVIRMAITHALQCPLAVTYQINVDYAALTRLQWFGERPPSLIFHNRTRL